MSTWTVERIAEVTRLWSEGLTTAEIGKVVGVTKNAVVGKAHRLGLPPRPSPIRRNNGGRATLPRAIAKTPMRPPRPIALSTSGARCKWPFGHPDEADFHFCGGRALVNKSYCPEHYQMAYLPARPRSEGKEAAAPDERPMDGARRSVSAA